MGVYSHSCRKHDGVSLAGVPGWKMVVVVVVVVVVVSVSVVVVVVEY